jgi:hypothetical protein
MLFLELQMLKTFVPAFTVMGLMPPSRRFSTSVVQGQPLLRRETWSVHEASITSLTSES